MPPEEIWGFSDWGACQKGKADEERRERALGSSCPASREIVHPLPTLKDRSGLGCITETNEFLTSWKYSPSPFAGGKN